MQPMLSRSINLAQRHPALIASLLVTSVFVWIAIGFSDRPSPVHLMLQSKWRFQESDVATSRVFLSSVKQACQHRGVELVVPADCETDFLSRMTDPSIPFGVKGPLVPAKIVAGLNANELGEMLCFLARQLACRIIVSDDRTIRFSNNGAE
jgi:hypothetical protein